MPSDHLLHYGRGKVSDKIMIIENLLNRVDNLIIGGGSDIYIHKAKGGRW